jgi:hypothetical protein
MNLHRLNSLHINPYWVLFMCCEDSGKNITKKAGALIRES